jgi:hypothetical protein
MDPRSQLSAFVFFISVLSSHSLFAQMIEPTFSGSYALSNLGQVPAQVPRPYGGLTFKDGDSNTLLLGGTANNPSASIYAVSLTRDTTGHISGFTGTPSSFSLADSIDGGLAYRNAGGVLFYTTSDNHLGQIEPGSTQPDRLIDLTPLGVATSTGALGFVPAGFGGPGRLKITSSDSGNWYDSNTSTDGFGTFDVNVSSGPVAFGAARGIDGFLFVAAGAAAFAGNSILLTEFNTGKVSAFTLDANSDPILGSEQTFISGLSGVLGAAVDPATGDFLFSTFSPVEAGNRIFLVQPVPEVGATFQMAVMSFVGLGTVLWLRRKCTISEP